MDRAARDAFFRAAPRRKHDMPVRALVQAGKISLPNFVITAEKPRDDLFGGFGLGNIGVHRSHRLRFLRESQCSPFGGAREGNLPGTCWSWPSGICGII